MYCATLHARIITYAKPAWVNTDVTQPFDLYLSVWLNLASADCLKLMTFASSNITIIRIRFHHLVLCLFFSFWLKQTHSEWSQASISQSACADFFIFVYKYLYIWNEMKQNTEARASTTLVICWQKFSHFILPLIIIGKYEEISG